jgi:hypothetical protein
VRCVVGYAAIGLECSDDGPVPRLFVARTLHVYVWPTVSPETVIVVVVPFFVFEPLFDTHWAV